MSKKIGCLFFNISLFNKNAPNKKENFKNDTFFVNNAINSFKVFHPDVDIHYITDDNFGQYLEELDINEYYDDLLEFLDELIEVYQGQYGIVENYEMIDTKDTNSKDKIEYFLEFVKFIKDTRKTTFSDEDTHLHNIIDEVVALTYKLIYKLKYNK